MPTRARKAASTFLNFVPPIVVSSPGTLRNFDSARTTERSNPMATVENSGSEKKLLPFPSTRSLFSLRNGIRWQVLYTCPAQAQKKVDGKPSEFWLFGWVLRSNVWVQSTIFLRRILQSLLQEAMQKIAD